MEYQKLKQVLEDKNYVFFDNGDYNLNFIWVRNDYHATNHFTDTLFIAYRVNGEEQVLELKCTTKPGLRGSLLNPITVEGVTGTDIIQPGQYRGTWKFIDSYTAFSSYPFFMQIKPINYWRDGDKDLEIDHQPGVDNAVERDGKIDGTQWHRMTNVGDKRKIEDFEINNWSLGCLGCPIIEWDTVLELTRTAVKNWGSVFTGTIINSTDLI